jgi:hypothetical protein
MRGPTISPRIWKVFAVCCAMMSCADTYYLYDSPPEEIEIRIEHKSKLLAVKLHDSSTWYNKAKESGFDTANWSHAQFFDVMTSDSRKVFDAKDLFRYNVFSKNYSAPSAGFDISFDFIVDSLSVNEKWCRALGHGSMQSYPPWHEDSAEIIISSEYDLNEYIASFCNKPLEISIITSKHDTLIMQDEFTCYFKED